MTCAVDLPWAAAMRANTALVCLLAASIAWATMSNRSGRRRRPSCQPVGLCEEWKGERRECLQALGTPLQAPLTWVTIANVQADASLALFRLGARPVTY